MGKSEASAELPDSALTPNQSSGHPKDNTARPAPRPQFLWTVWLGSGGRNIYFNDRQAEAADSPGSAPGSSRSREKSPRDHFRDGAH